MRRRVSLMSMSRAALLPTALFAVVAACSGDDKSAIPADAGPDATLDATPADDATPTPGIDASKDDASASDGNASDAASDSPADAAIDAPDAACTNLMTETANCGVCGYACLHGRTCVAGRCTPAWQPLSAVGVPVGRDRHAAAGLGTKYVATGGTLTFQSVGITAAVAYDLATDTWSTYSSALSQRCSHEIVSTGTKLYAFGGLTDCSNGAAVASGLEESAGGAWTYTGAANEPPARYNFAMAWTGTEIFAYGGGSGVGPAIATGGRLTPGGAWVDAGCGLAGCERGGYFTVFREGNVMHLFGGGAYGNAPAGLEYDLALGTWAPWTVPVGTPDFALLMRHADDGRRIYHVRQGATCTDLPTLDIYDRKTKAWSTDTSTPPAGLIARGAAAWVGGELVVWGGDCGAGPITVGGRFQPAAVAP